MKQARIALVAALSAAALLAASRGAAQTVVVGPGSSSVAALPGTQFSVPVVADMTSAGGASLGSITARLLWRPAGARLIGTSPGTFGAPVVNVDTVNGVIKFAVANPAGATGTPVLLNALFQAVDTVAGDTMTFHLGLDEVTRAGTFTDLLPISVTTGSMFCVSGGEWGDLSGDATVGAFDAAIVVTNAVGLPIAPYSVRNGDVDGDGKVTTRDALGILTYVVGLPTPGFRIGVLNTGSCAVQGAASLTVTPLTLSLASGDRLPLTAVVKDSAGVTVASFPAVGWQSQDTTVAKVDALGQVTAVGAGATRVVAFLQPGVADTAAVTVSATRHIWYVNPAVAAGNSVELGSSAYPFSSIGPAVTAAAAGDTIDVAPALYGEHVHVTKSLVFLGDSTAAGIPRLRFGTGVAMAIDSGLTVSVTRFQIEDSQGGIAAFHAAALALADITVLRSTGPGIQAVGGGTLAVSATTIAGAVDMGIAAESLLVASFHQVSVDLIASSGGKRPGTIGATATDSVDVLGVSAQTASLQLNGDRAVSVRTATVKGTQGPGFEINGGTNAAIVGLDVSGAQAQGTFPSQTDFYSHAVAIILLPSGALRLDSSAIHDNTQLALLALGPASITSRGLSLLRNGGAPLTATAVVGVAGSVHVVQATASANGGGNFLVADSAARAVAAVVDSSTFAQGGVGALSLASFTMHGGRVSGATGYGIAAQYTPVVTLSGVEVTGTQPAGTIGSGMAAVGIQLAQVVQLDSLWLHDNLSGAIDVESSLNVTISGGTITTSWLAPPVSLGSYLPSVRVANVTQGRLAQTVIDDRGGMGTHSFDVLVSSPGKMVVDSVTFVGSVSGVSALATYGVNGIDTLIVRGSSFTAGGTPVGTAIQHTNFTSFQVLGNTIDSVAGYGVFGINTGTSTMQNNVITHVMSGGGMYLSSAGFGDSLIATGNQLTCSAPAPGILLYYAPAFATGNTVHGCATGIYANAGSYGPLAAAIRGNTVTTDSVNSTQGVILYGWYTHPDISLNDVGAGRYQNAIWVNGAGNGIDSLFVDSNTVHDLLGRAIYVTGAVGHALLRANTVTRYDTGAGAAEGVLLSHTGGARLTGNKLSATSANGLNFASSIDTLYFDSTVVVDDSAVAVTMAPANVFGRYNFLARNGTAMAGTGGILSIDSSVFQGNTHGVHGPISWTVNNDYWGSATGPNTAGADSAVGVNADIWLTAPPASTPSGAPRAFPAARPRAVAAVFAAPAGASRAVRPADFRAARPSPSAVDEARAAVVRTQSEQVRRAREGTAP